MTSIFPNLATASSIAFFTSFATDTSACIKIISSLTNFAAACSMLFSEFDIMQSFAPAL